MTTKDLAGLIGKRLGVTYKDLTLFVTVVDARVTYGRVHVLVQMVPGAGLGETWIEFHEGMLKKGGD